MKRRRQDSASAEVSGPSGQETQTREESIARRHTRDRVASSLIKDKAQAEIIEIVSSDEADTMSTPSFPINFCRNSEVETSSVAQKPIEVVSDGEDEQPGNVDEYALHIYIGSFMTRIVGIQYYRGGVTTSESVNLLESSGQLLIALDFVATGTSECLR